MRDLIRDLYVARYIRIPRIVTGCLLIILAPILALDQSSLPACGTIRATDQPCR